MDKYRVKFTANYFGDDGTFFEPFQTLRISLLPSRSSSAERTRKATFIPS
jgi:hypothetical protein